MSKKTLFVALLGGVACFATSVQAHYLWVASDQATTNIYFEEGPAAGDGQYLDPFVKAGQAWIRTVEHLEPQPLKIVEVTETDKRWLTAELPHAAPRSIDSYGKLGVYRYGQTDVLLHYYARRLDVATHEDLHELARAEHMDLDIVPHDHGDEVELTVLWEGEPAADRTVFIRGPKGFNQNTNTDDKGMVNFKPEAPGHYLFRTSVEEDESGQDDGMDYVLIRHNATLALKLPLEK